MTGASAPAASALSPGQALERALVRAAQDGLGLALNVAGIGETTPQAADMAKDLGPHALVLMTEGPDGAQGVAAASAGLVAAIISQQMTGQVPDPLPEARAPTRIDAAMTTAFLQDVLGRFASALQGQGGLDWAQGFRPGAQLPDPRLLRFSMPQIAYRGFDVALELGTIGQRADLRLIFPAQRTDRASAGGPGLGDGEWRQALRAGVLHADVGIEAVLLRHKVPLDALMRWAPGTVIPLSSAALDEVRLEGPGGGLLCRAKLGRSRGVRAVRLQGEVAAPPPSGDAG